MKKEKAITLIVLVISIIVLIILAGVSINTLINNGIIDKAKTATQEYKNAQDYEETQISKYTNYIESNVDGSRETVTISKEEYDILKNANTYSTTETEIGLLNGEKLYRKIIDGKFNSNISQSFVHNVTNIKTALITGAYLDGDDGFQYTLNLDSHFVEAYIDTTNINIKKAAASNYQNNNVHFIIEYTKTTN